MNGNIHNLLVKILTDTRWSADKTDNQWIVVDLQKEYSLDSVTINFHAESPEYEIQIAREDKQFKTVSNITDGSTNGASCTKTFDLMGQNAGYVKYQQNKMWKHSTNNQFYGSSIIELTVKEKKNISVSDDTLRIGTFNIAANKQPNVDELRELTEKYKLEVVGLQEVDRNTGRNPYDMLNEFASTTYPSTYFSKAIDYDGGEYGIATASKYELTDAKTVNVDSTGATEQRVYQRMVFKKDNYEIAFYNTHLSYETEANAVIKAIILSFRKYKHIKNPTTIISKITSNPIRKICLLDLLLFNVSFKYFE